MLHDNPLLDKDALVFGVAVVKHLELFYILSQMASVKRKGLLCPFVVILKCFVEVGSLIYAVQEHRVDQVFTVNNSTLD